MSLAGAVPAAFEQVVSQCDCSAYRALALRPLSNHRLTILSQGLLGGLGGAVGAALASKVGPTELPQTVAAFHSLGKRLNIDHVT